MLSCSMEWSIDPLRLGLLDCALENQFSSGVGERRRRKGESVRGKKKRDKEKKERGGQNTNHNEMK